MIPHSDAPFHPWPWLLWGAAVLAAALLTQNPLYASLLLLALLWVRAALVRGEPSLPPALRWGWWLPLLTAVATMLTVHVGESVVGELPRHWPLLGGPLTLEALAYGFSTGFTLLLLLALFGTLGLGTEGHALLRLIPPFLFQAGLVTSIALAFVPQTARALEEIREAQQIRGHRFRGWRDLPPLFLPLLTMGLERSVQLAEAMESRGLGGVERGRGHAGSRALRDRLLLLGGLSALAGGVALLLLSPWRGAGAALVAAGGTLMALALRRLGRRVQRSRYRRHPWQRRDQWLALGSATLLAGLLATTLLARSLLLFYPYPRLSAPPFDPRIGALLLLAALPALLVPAPPTQEKEQ